MSSNHTNGNNKLIRSPSTLYHNYSKKNMNYNISHRNILILKLIAYIINYIY